MSQFWDNSDGGSYQTVQSGTATTVSYNAIIGPGTSGKTIMAEPWDTCVLQGKSVPGLVNVNVAARQRRVQNKKQNGTDGNTPTYRGMDPGKGTIEVVIWTPDQFTAWESLLPIIFPNPSKDVNKLSAIDISSPQTQNRGIKSIIIDDIDGPVSGPVHGSKKWVLKWFEYLPSKKAAVKTVVGSVATTDAFKPAQPSKNAPLPPSQTDFGPTQSFQPAQGGT